VSLLRPDWQNVITNIPGTIAAVAGDPRYGLASTSDEGRRAAVDDVRALHADVTAMRAALGDAAVLAVELHSAPVAGLGASSAELFSDSLAEIAGWDWGAARLVVEHADALVGWHAPQKGWLSLDAEIDATRRATERTGRSIAHSVNWGRSAIETESADGAQDHLRRLLAADALAGFMVSGAAPEATARSTPWQDVHLAVDTIEPESLLTELALDRALETIAGADLLYVGVKVGRAADATTSSERLAPGLATLRTLDRLALRGVR
jgi:hypothetical protein